MRRLRKSEAMAKAGAIVLFLCQLSVFVCGIYGFLDMEELKSVNYGIDIENTPVMFKEELPEGAVRLSSKHGQQYQCSYPDKVTKEKQEEKEKIAMETGIPELLKPMEEGPCLHYSQGWWDYEFCYGKHIRQFHMEDGKIHSDVIFLGHYESEYDWNNVSATQANRLNRYHSQRYVNGSLCDLTGKARRTEVRFVCADGQGDYLGRVEEAESCVYVLTVYTTKICRHPYLKPPSVNRPVTITCSPLLDAEQYQEYLHDQKESVIADETADRFSKFPPEAAQYDDSAALTGDGSGESESSKENTFVESLMNGIREMLAENAQEGNKAVLNSDILKSARDISKSIQQQLRQQKEKSAKTQRETESSDDEGDDDEDGDDIVDDDPMKRDWQKLRDRMEAIKRKRAEAIAKSEVGRNTLEEGRSREQDRKREGGSEEGKEEEDADVMEEFDKGLQDIAPSAQDKARLASHSDSVRTALQSQFNDIIEEVSAQCVTCHKSHDS
ncbi:hypothetical protein NP493_563g02001 [Ridgeia piscesae]|uniref:MRH domain-containing protein n=1 Tax=Ridgeia piscesae TaxID=27915 RepID=A0AAD9KUT6_RIDPI|nr:hypothetical protein NP493_563g02001 [Ridgeia piscesae]